MKPYTQLFAICIGLFFSGICKCASGQGTQVMGVPQGTSVQFRQGNAVFVPAFCLEGKVSKAPYSFTELTNVSGKIRIVYEDGRASRDTDLEKALAERTFRIRGADYKDNGRAIAIESLDLAISRVDFLTHAAFADKVLAYELSSSGFGEEILKPLDALDLKLYHEALQKGDSKQIAEMQVTLWDFESAFVKGDGPGEWLSRRAPTSNPSTVKMYGLSSQADCCLISASGGKTIIHDLGTTAEELERVVSEIPAVNGKRSISVFITHAHMDHYKGLVTLLDRPDVIIEQIIIGYPKARSDRKTEPRGSFEELLNSIHDAGYIIPKECPDRVTQFVKNNVPSSLRIQFISRADADVIGVISDIALGTYRIFFPTTTDLNSRKKHDFNIVTNYECRQTRVLDFGDADPPQIRSILESHLEALAAVKYTNYPEAYKMRCKELLDAVIEDKTSQEKFEKLKLANPSQVISHQLLEVDVLKWPHHAWRPSDESTQKLMKRLIKALRPKEIILSVKIDENNPDVLKRIDAIDALIRQACEEEQKAGRHLRVKLRRTMIKYFVLRKAGVFCTPSVGLSQGRLNWKVACSSSYTRARDGEGI